jgi:2-keto-4-pentenoate hydratase
VSTPVWEDERIVAGMEGLLERRRRALEAGERPIGWKLAFGTEETKTALGISGPAVGYLTDATLLEPGAGCSIAGWTKPVLEAEIGIHLGSDVAAGDGAEAAAGAIESLGPAIELADADSPPDRLTDVVAGDIYHRRVMLAPPELRRPGAAAGDLRVSVRRDGAQCESTDDPETTVGALGVLVAHVASYLAAFGERLRAGEVLISGSTIPMVALEPGQRFEYELEPVGTLGIEIEGGAGSAPTA